ncbi:MAG: hypothetical protein ACFFDI_18820 [Promethearchaeota archaeon]
MVFEKIVVNSLVYTTIGASYLLIFMITFNPRIWGYQDYPDRIKKKIPSQTREERVTGGLVGMPWFIFIFGYPLVSTAFFEADLGGEISFEVAFLNMFSMVLLFFLVDLVVLDWFIISKITPRFVIIDGTTPEDYKDFSHHYKRHLIALIPLTLLCLLFSAIIFL